MDSLPAEHLPYGRDLAVRVADFLQAGGMIAYQHKDYCGRGLAFLEGHFIYDEVFGGYMSCLYQRPPRSEDAIALFKDREAFIDWLAAQTDRSMKTTDEEWDYQGDERISRARLEAAVSGNKKTDV